MILSNSLPIQFWPAGEETFNEKVVCGLNRQDCFCQPIECDDTIIIQYKDGDFAASLLVYDSNDELIYSDSFSQVYPDVGPAITGLYQISFSPSAASPSICDKQIRLEISQAFLNPTFIGLTNWTQTTNCPTSDITSPGTVAWTSLSPYATSGNYNHAYTEWITQNFPFAAGNYTFTIVFEVVGAANSLYCLLGTTANTDIVGIFDSSHAAVEYIGGGGSNEAFTAGIHTVTRSIDIVGTYEFITFQGGFTFSNTNVTIRSITINDDNIVPLFKSDCIDVRTTQECTKLIEYTNSSNFDSIIYNGPATPPVFNLRIPAVFYEENNPQEQEVLPLSNGEIVVIRSSIQQKRELETGYMPNYMHLKLQKVLMHETIMIDGWQWIKQDSYDPKNVKKYNLKMATVLLTKYNSVEKNTI